MRILSDEEIRNIRNRYPEGTRVKMIRMDDPQSPPPGTLGTVTFVDDLGDIGVAWDTGSSLKLIPGEDEAEILVPDFTDTVRRAVMKVRDSGITNMLDVNMVQRLAFDWNEYALVLFIEDHRKEYIHFIMTGRIC